MLTGGMAEQLLSFASLTAARNWLQHSVSRQLFDYFSHLYASAGDDLPLKSNIDPVALKGCLPHMVVMDCAEPAAPRYRLAGEAYIQLLGANPAGRPYLDFVPTERHATASEAYVACMTHRCGMLTRLITINRIGREIECEVVNLPVCDDAEPKRARFLYVTLVPQGDASWDSDELRYSQYREVRQRAFIDLGSGVPAQFAGQPISPA